jgi:excisionase family DNA binding protein
MLARDLQDAILTVQEVADILHCPPWKVYTLIHRDGLPIVRLHTKNSGIRILREDLVNWLQSRKQTTEPVPA